MRKRPGFVGVNRRFGQLSDTEVDIEGTAAVGQFRRVTLLLVPVIPGVLQLENLLDPL